MRRTIGRVFVAVALFMIIAVDASVGVSVVILIWRLGGLAVGKPICLARPHACAKRDRTAQHTSGVASWNR